MSAPPTPEATGASCTATHRLRTGLYLLPHGDDEIFVRDGSRSAFSKIVSDPDRRRLLTCVVQAAAAPVSAQSLAEAWSEDLSALSSIIDQLADAGVLAPIERAAPTTLVALLGQGHVARTTELLAQGTDHLSIIRPTDLEDVATLLDERREDDPAGPVVIAVANDALDPELALDANALALERHVPVVFTHVDGTEAVVGPFVIPGETACYLCHDLQDEGARHLRDEFIVYKDSLRRGIPGPGADPAVAGLAAAWLRLALDRWRSDSRGFLDQRVLRVECSRMEVMTHRILTIPRCPACSTTRAELQHTFL